MKNLKEYGYQRINDNMASLKFGKHDIQLFSGIEKIDNHYRLDLCKVHTVESAALCEQILMKFEAFSDKAVLVIYVPAEDGDNKIFIEKMKKTVAEHISHKREAIKGMLIDRVRQFYERVDFSEDCEFVLYENAVSLEIKLKGQLAADLELKSIEGSELELFAKREIEKY